MKAVFADTFYYYALLNPDDEMHEAARDFTVSFQGTVVTTAWVLTELGDGLARVPNRPLFLDLVAELRTDPDVIVISPDPQIFEEGLALFRERPDKDWSLTDCISFVVMKREGIRAAALGNPPSPFADTCGVSNSTTTDVEAERHRLRMALEELTTAQRVYAGNPIALGVIKGRIEKIRDRLYDLEKAQRTPQSK